MRAILIPFALIALTACQTVHGIGQDIAAVGDGVSHVASELNDEVFGGYGDRSTAARYGRVSAGTLCDPNAREVRYGALPPCYTVANPQPVRVQ